MDTEDFKNAVLENWNSARENGYYEGSDYTWQDVALDMIAFAQDIEEYADKYGDEAVVAAIVDILEHTE